ncbi:adenosine deaminase [Saccharomonospora sp. NPDC006951]
MDRAEIVDIPKAELHVHIEGTLEPELAFLLARRNGLTLPYTDSTELRARYAFTSLQSFLDLYYGLMDVLRTAEDFRDLTTAYLDRARQDGIRHAEIFFDPQAHLRRGVPLEAMLEGFGAAIAASEGPSAYLIPCFLRDLGPDAAMDTLGELLPYADRFAAVGLDSAEAGYPPEPFADVFARARAAGLPAVAHAGEEGPSDYVRQALVSLHARRIDHGVRCLDDPELVLRLAAEQIPLTVCPLSNVMLGGVARIEEHALPRLLAAGLTVTLNSDDPAYFGGYLADVYQHVARTFGYDIATMRAFGETSIRASFLPATEQQRLLGPL